MNTTEGTNPEMQYNKIMYPPDKPDFFWSLAMCKHINMPLRTKI